MKFITSSNNSDFKYLKALNNPKKRKKHKAFLIEGSSFVRDAILKKSDLVSYLVVSESAFQKSKPAELIQLAEQKGIPVWILSENLFKEVSVSVTPQGIMAVIKEPQEQNIIGNQLIILENLQDPANVGTILRTADAVGIKTILYTKGTADPYSPKTIRSSAGSILNLSILRVQNVKEVVFLLKEQGFSIIAAVVEGGESLFKIDYPEKYCLIVGNEAKGVSHEMLSMADKLITIPMKGETQSLNVAIATGVILYHFFYLESLKNS